MRLTSTFSEKLKERTRQVGETLVEKFFYCIGWFLWTLYVVVADTVQNIFDFFVSAFFLYISWGIILMVVSVVLWLITKALGAH
jgi:hypothetical protein